MNNRVSLIVIMLSVFSSATLAVPKNIVVDSGDLQSGKLTITGAGFGNTGANVIMYERFESDTALEGNKSPRASSDLGQWASNSPGLGYSKIAHSGKFGGNGRDGRLKLDFGKGIQEIFISYWVRLPDGQLFPGSIWTDGYVKAPGNFPKDSSWKFTWLYDRDVVGKSSDVCLPTQVGGGVFYLAGNDFNLDTKIGNRETWWSWNSWIRISTWLKANPADPTRDGDLLFQTISAEKGVREYKSRTPIFDGDFANGPGETYAGEPNVQQWQHLNIPGWMRSNSDPGTHLGFKPAGG